MRIQSSNIATQNKKDYRIKNQHATSKNKNNRSSTRQKSENEFEQITTFKPTSKNLVGRNEANYLSIANSTDKDKSNYNQMEQTQTKFKENKFKIVKLQNNYIPKKNQNSLNDFNLDRSDLKDLSLENVKKVLYLYNNDIKTAFNAYVQENKQMETKIKQMRKEREQLEKDLNSGRSLPLKYLHKKNSFVKVEEQKVLKESLKQKKDTCEALKEEYKNLKNLLKDENLTNLKNENISLVNSLIILKKTVIEENFEIEQENNFLDLKNNDNDEEKKYTAKNYQECEKLLTKKVAKKKKLEVL